VTGEAIVAHLADGRVVSVPLEWSWRLTDATAEQRAHWEIIGDGQGVHWPDIDEDISVEGMLRGVPAKRPSRTEMRILLDASSLIDAEHGKPVSFGELDKILREHHARVILTLTNVMEFAEPLARKSDRFALRAQLQQVERLPIGYLCEVGIWPAELKEAAQAFSENRECFPVNPYVKRWDETLPAAGPTLVGMLVNQSLSDLVPMAFARRSVLRQAKEFWESRLKSGYERAKMLPCRTSKAGAEEFQAEIREGVTLHPVEVPPGVAGKLAKWVYDDPTRCPGYRLAYESLQEQKKNLTERFSWNDIFDRAHLLAVPYVDAVTMDSNTADLCRRVIRRLKAKNPAINYEERIFTSLKELLGARF
jgi:hypothetical protein